MPGQQASSERLLQRFRRHALAEHKQWAAQQIFTTILLRVRRRCAHGKDCRHDSDLMAPSCVSAPCLV